MVRLKFFLINREGQSSNIDIAHVKYKLYDYDSQIWSIQNRIASYWCTEAQEHIDSYIKELHKAVQPLGACPVPNIGCCEWFFPCSGTLPSLNNSPWWYDSAAQKSIGEKSPLEWWLSERIKIIDKRCSLYNHRWFHFVLFNPFTDVSIGADDLNFGNIGIRYTIDHYYPNSNFVIFEPTHWDINFANSIASKHKVWGGANGVINVVKRTQDLISRGFQGTLCQLYDWGEIELPSWKWDELKKLKTIDR